MIWGATPEEWDHFAYALDLIADPEVEAVAISSPATTHTDLVVAAARAKKFVTATYAAQQK